MIGPVEAVVPLAGAAAAHAAAAAAGEDSGEGVSAWGALFARHRAGIGAYMSQKDQMR